METAWWILLGIMAAGAFAAAILSFKEKGLLFNNAWLYASKEEREQMNKTPYYKQTGVVFLLVGLMFLLSCLEVALHAGWLLYAILFTAVAAVVYAVASSVKLNKK